MAKKQKLEGFELTEALSTFGTMMQYHKTMEDARKSLSGKFVDIGMGYDSNMHDPYTIRALCRNLTTNEPDFIILFDRAMKENPTAALNLMKYNYWGRATEDAEMKVALDVLMDRPDEMFELIEMEKQLSKERLATLWDKHSVYWFKKHGLAPVKLELLCRTFREYVEHEHLALMVKRYVGRKMDAHARRLQEDKFMALPPDLIDQLEGCIMMKTLMNSNK